MRGNLTGNTKRAIAKVQATLEQAIDNGNSADVAALSAKIANAQSVAEQAEATGQNARQMVLNRDPRLSSVETNTQDLQALAADYQAQLVDSVADRQAIHDGIDTLRQMVSQIQVVPGKDGAPGAAGKDGAAGLNGADGATAYQLARAAGYGGTQTQWLATLKGDKGDAGTPADMTRVAALEAQKMQIEYRDGIPVPATSLLGLAGTIDIAVTWASPFPDTAYTIVKPQTSAASASLIGKTDAVVKSKTMTGCVTTVTTTALLSVGNVTLSVLAYRKG